MYKQRWIVEAGRDKTLKKSICLTASPGSSAGRLGWQSIVNAAKQNLCGSLDHALGAENFRLPDRRDWLNVDRTPHRPDSWWNRRRNPARHGRRSSVLLISW
jgi:hypothetical protein